MFSEGGLVETLQFGSWIMVALLAIFAALRHRGRRDASFALWVAVVAGVCALRELDAHIYLNPETMGSWGVRYRIDWWLDRDSPVLPRVAWALTGLVLACLVIVPLLIARPKPFVLLVAQDRAALCAVAGAVFLALGYAADDLIGRGLIVSRDVSKPIEEISELIGVLWIGTGVWLLSQQPLTARHARAKLKPPA
jgi:hypothetical protein